MQDSKSRCNHCSTADDQKRFYRFFMGYPQSLENHTNIMYSFLQTEGSHFKSYQYNGVCIIYCSKTGFGNNVILAFSTVPRENSKHHSWSLQMLWRCSPNMTKSYDKSTTELVHNNLRTWESLQVLVSWQFKQGKGILIKLGVGGWSSLPDYSD